MKIDSLWIRGALIAAALLAPVEGELLAAPSSALQVATAPAAKPNSPKAKLLSPYARAAAAHTANPQATTGHSPTAVQGMGHPRRTHAGTVK